MQMRCDCCRDEGDDDDDNAFSLSLLLSRVSPNKSWANTTESPPLPAVASMAESMPGRTTCDHNDCAKAIEVMVGLVPYESVESVAVLKVRIILSFAFSKL